MGGLILARMDKECELNMTSNGVEKPDILEVNLKCNPTPSTCSISQNLDSFEYSYKEPNLWIPRVSQKLERAVRTTSHAKLITYTFERSSNCINCNKPTDGNVCNQCIGAPSKERKDLKDMTIEYIKREYSEVTAKELIERINIFGCNVPRLENFVNSINKLLEDCYKDSYRDYRNEDDLIGTRNNVEQLIAIIKESTK